MQSVTCIRTIDAQPAAVRTAMERVGPFVEAAGFDEVEVDGDDLRVANQVGPVSIELELEVVETPEAPLAYEQREGIFEEMQTTYAVEHIEEGSEVTARTEFAVDVAVVGPALDATVIKRQRRRELEAQFDWLEAQVADPAAT